MSKNKEKKPNISSNEESSNEESSNEETSISSINDDKLSEIDKQSKLEQPEENLEKEFSRFDCNNDNNTFSNECNKFLLKKELMEHQYLSSDENQFDYLYPNLNDKDFNIKISNKKEFNDTTYDGTIYKNIKKAAAYQCTV